MPFKSEFKKGFGVGASLQHFVSTPCLHTLSLYASSPHLVPTLCRKRKSKRQFRLPVRSRCANRGRDGALSCAAPPSEPYRRISRIRLSSRWCYRSHGLAAYAQAATQENSPCSVKKAFDQRLTICLPSPLSPGSPTCASSRHTAPPTPPGRVPLPPV